MSYHYMSHNSMSNNFMNYYKRICLAALASLCLAMSVNIDTANAQSNVIVDTAYSTAAKPSVTVALQPFFLLNNAGKIDVELQSAGKKIGYLFTAEVYSGQTKDESDGFDNRSRGDWDKINGIGVGISRKYKFKDERSSPYLTYGLTYRYMEISFETDGFYTYQVDGLTYYDYGKLENNVAISSGLVSATFGYQKIVDDFVYDFYFGFGYKAPLNKPDFKGYREYDQSIINHAYKGVGMLVGFKLGYQFR